MLHQLIIKSRSLECINPPSADREVDRTSSGLSVGSRIVTPLDHQHLETRLAKQPRKEASGKTRSGNDHSIWCVLAHVFPRTQAVS